MLRVDTFFMQWSNSNTY